tara:strand:- start:1263 stop:1385 length:123 start_codon:yes stop_codon:yes gene_type:complete
MVLDPGVTFSVSEIYEGFLSKDLLEPPAFMPILRMNASLI